MSAALPIAAERLLDPEAAADHLTSLYRLAWSLCGSRHLAEELTQETYARVLARPRRLKEAAARVGEVYAEIGRLPGHLREVVAAVDVAGLTYAETAEALRIPNGTVMSRLFRARERLAVALAA
jgi:RNA polymerase sigma-70 factor (ECF subfamily)